MKGRKGENMNRITISGRLTETPKVMGTGENKWGLVKFWHKDGEDADGNMRISYRTVFCSYKTAQYLLDRGWDKGDEIFVDGAERIETNTKDGKSYTNVIIYNATVECGLKQGDTLANRKNEPASVNTPVEHPQEAKAAPPKEQEPRSMEELEEFDEESMIID